MVIDRMMPADGKFKMPTQPPFVNGKPTFNTSGLDQKGLMALKETLEYIDKHNMKPPNEGKWRQPYDMKTGKPQYDRRGLNDRELDEGY
jgi:hypothetical protein